MTPNKIIIHCSASDHSLDDSLQAITTLHTSREGKKVRWKNQLVKGRGWKKVGYHFVITQDGGIHLGRPLWMVGAHTYGHNSSIGICLTGETFFTEEQFASLRLLVKFCKGMYGKLPVHPHSDFSDKTCPNFDIKVALNEDS